jgi:hypothetical protein
LHRQALGFLKWSGIDGEVLVADNGSTNGSQEIGRTYLGNPVLGFLGPDYFLAARLAIFIVACAFSTLTLYVVAPASEMVVRASLADYGIEEVLIALTRWPYPGAITINLRRFPSLCRSKRQLRFPS